MAFQEKHQKIIDTHLYLDDLGEEDGPRLTLEVNKRQMRLVLEALEHYQETKCPVNTGEGGCAMLFWGEDVHTGAIERVCSGSCAALVEDLVINKIPAAFPPKLPEQTEKKPGGSR